MRHTTSLFLAGLASAAAALAPAAASAGSERSASAIGSHQALSTEFSAQERPRVRRVPPRIYVYPDYRNRPIVRRCVDWYTVEARAAGDTVIPHMRCYWVVGR